MFLTTHYMDEAYYLADRIDVIHQGKIIAEGSPEDLINQYGGGNTLIIRGCDRPRCGLLAGEIPERRFRATTCWQSCPTGDGMGSIMKAVVRSTSGLACKEIYVKKSTLEDVFLNLTGEKLTQRGGLNEQDTFAKSKYSLIQFARNRGEHVVHPRVPAALLFVVIGFMYTSQGGPMSLYVLDNDTHAGIRRFPYVQSMNRQAWSRS